uniref:Uncharacterized protein n=1 Tax=Amphimedon queenslandica TaxID=400682 RepID=A0A1X7UAZ8_AMPQE
MITNLDSKIATGSDISKYKLMNVKKHLLTIGKSVLTCYTFLLHFQLGKMKSIIADKAIQHRLYH